MTPKKDLNLRNSRLLSPLAQKKIRELIQYLMVIELLKFYPKDQLPNKNEEKKIEAQCTRRQQNCHLQYLRNAKLPRTRILLTSTKRMKALFVQV